MADKFRVNSKADWSNVVECVRNIGFPCEVMVSKASRTLSQNALLHMWCTEIAKFFVDNGKTEFASGEKMEMESVKRNLKQTFLGDELKRDSDLKTGEIRYRYELRHTSQLDKGEFQQFMEQIDGWATEHGIPLTRPIESEYVRYRQEQGEMA